MKKATFAIAAFVALASGVYFPFLNYVEPVEEGVAWDFVHGDLYLQKKGWNVTSPWTLVARVDTRPVRVCVTSAGRGFNCKLVQFEPSAFKEFVQTEGFRYYWWANRLSFNFGYDEEYRGMKDLLRGYAYSTKRYPFVTVLRDYDSPE